MYNIFFLSIIIMSSNNEMSNTLDDLEIQLSNTVTDTKNAVKKTTRRVSNIADELKNHLIQNYPNGFTLENILDLVIQSVQYLNKLRNMSGNQKRQCIIDALLLLLDETNSGELEFYEPIIKSMIPSTVNTLIDVEKKKIKLNKRIKRGCLGCC